MSRLLGILLLVVSSALSAAAGEGESTDHLIVTGAFDPGVGTSRRRGEIQWLRQGPDGHWSGGLAHSKVARASWLVGELGGSRVVAPRWRLLGLLRAGPGRGAERDFDYRLAAMGVAYAWRPGTLYLEVGAQAFDIDRASGHLAQTGLTWAVHSSLSTAWTYTTSVGGDARFDFLSARIDVLRDAATYLMGATAGDTVPALLDPSDTGAQFAIEYRQAFVGWRLPGAKVGVDLILEYEEIGGFSRAALQSSLRFVVPTSSRDAAP